MPIRLGVIQPGGFLEAGRRLDSGDPEFYFDVRESIDALRFLFGSNDHFVINLDAPREFIKWKHASYRGLPISALPANLCAFKNRRHRRVACGGLLRQE